MKKTDVIVIGAGFSGIAAATSLAAKGFSVTILEKNEQAGGRARVWHKDGFTFDMGPSWYWMPNIFEDYFKRFDSSVSDHYDLKRLDPSYRVIFKDKDIVDLPAGLVPLKKLFESIEPGSAQKLDQFLKEAEYKYKVGIGEFVWKPSHSITEFFDPKIVTSALKLDLLKSMAKHARRFFSNPKLLEIIEFPVLFLGATPENTPALYSLMNYAEMALGTWYPMGGMHMIVKGMVSLAESKGVEIKYNEEVTGFDIVGNNCKKVNTTGSVYEARAVISAADYRHIDKLLGKNENHDEAYWQKRVMAPSSLIYYLGLDRQIPNLVHHNLFFDEDFKQHAYEIYTKPQWPSKPLFYASAPSKTDPSVAPKGKENVFILVPVAPGLTNDNDELRERYFNTIMDRLQQHTGVDLRKHIEVKRSYAHSNFISDYHSFKGNAYGLANTLTQTAFLKPKMKHRTLNNFYYTGQLTVPGPGVPPSLISGIVVGQEVQKLLGVPTIKHNNTLETV